MSLASFRTATLTRPATAAAALAFVCVVEAGALRLDILGLRLHCPSAQLAAERPALRGQEFKSHQASAVTADEIDPGPQSREQP